MQFTEWVKDESVYLITAAGFFMVMLASAQDIAVVISINCIIVWLGKIILF
jgi:uncharacterized RDD family membrane protein YckC